MKIKKYALTIALLSISLPLLLFSILATGGGHANFEQLFFLFPWIFCFGAVFAFLNNIGIFIVPALLQFLFYGAALDWFRFKNKLILGIITVGVCHLIAAGFALRLF